MNKKSNYSFIASNKVIRHELGVKAADVLATLIYKYKHWENEKKLQLRDELPCFFASLNDLKSETGYNKNIISKHIKILKKHELVKSIQQGLNRPNLYSVNFDAIDRFIAKHEKSFKDWQNSVRAGKLYSSRSITGNSINDVTGISNKGIQELSNQYATNNLNTNNKSTNKSFTNRASSANDTNLEDKLEKLIEDIRSCSDGHNKNSINTLFKFLCDLVPSFRNFKMSEEDKALLEAIVYSEIEVCKFSSRIISNAIKINDRQKNARFGNLFVGVKEIIANYNNLS
ncbi:helix-turn-helix domain-containing protein [Winogradskyella vincentii]|uniref:Helix-turn-helix domain-containing protein n=1 Tax=Winogradskyella vincentii TaxID=2877122 RepID=A0ABS7XXG3_9FLAO|nr:helix-turn-helix domain-containing protein [Winogradskyella vincentii]MCA0151724.1 helix-turn-helix domain-containing protein [Winogradskyella vincentii]